MKNNKYMLALLVALGLAAGLAAADSLAGRALAKKMRGLRVWDDYAEYMLSDNQKLIFEPKAYAGPFKSCGQRGKEYFFGKSSKKRLVVLGDSVLHAYVVEPPLRATDILERKLGGGWEVVNLAVNGYNILQELEFLKKYGLKFQPDAVLVGTTYNDLEIGSCALLTFDKEMAGRKDRDFFYDLYDHNNTAAAWLRSTNLYKAWLYFKAVRAPSKPGRAMCYKLGPAETDDIVKEFKQLSEKHGFRLLFAFLPRNIGPETKGEIPELTRACGKNGVAFADLEKVFSGRSKPGDKRLYFVDEYHSGVEGNRMLGELLFEAVKSKKLLEP